MKFLDGDTTALMFRFPADMAPRQGEPNRLNEQTLVHDFERDWRNVIR